MFESPEPKNNRSPHLAFWAMIAAFVFLVTCIFGEGMGGSLGSNPFCWPHIGCTDGFFGYDAIEHFLFGIAGTWMLVWIFQEFPQYALFHSKRWKNILTILSLVIFLSVIWEFFECVHDFFRLEILHQSLINIKLHINYLDQPTNLDTMGDLTFALLGSIVALFYPKL